jgi:hypothetical protein
MHEPKTNWWRLAGWGAFAAGGVGVAVGTVGYLQYRSTVLEFNGKRDGGGEKRCFDDGTSIFGPNRSPPPEDCSQLASKYRSARRLSIVGFTAGAVLLTSAIVITVVTTPAKESRLALKCGLHIGGAMMCEGRF